MEGASRKSRNGSNWAFLVRFETITIAADEGAGGSIVVIGNVDSFYAELLSLIEPQIHLLVADVG